MLRPKRLKKLLNVDPVPALVFGMKNTSQILLIQPKNVMIVRQFRLKSRHILGKVITVEKYQTTKSNFQELSFQLCDKSS